jgi:hypothetical protein
MASISDLKHHMQMIGTLEEYEFLSNFSPATLNLEQQEYVRKRLETIEAEARIRSTLPYEVQREIYQHLLRDSEPIDITRRENHVTPDHYTDPHVEFDYWRLTPFVYSTDNVHDAVVSMNALEFVEDVLLNPTHMARFQILNPPKQITFEVLIRWDFLAEFLPEISLANMDSLFDLLHVFDGDVNRIKLKFLFKDSRVDYSRDPSTKREIAPNNEGRLRIMKAKMLDLLQTAMMAYHNVFHAPARISATSGFARQMAVRNILDPNMTDAAKHQIVRNWLGTTCSDLLDNMWSSDPRRAGFVKYHMLRAFEMDQRYYDRDEDVEDYVERMGIPFLPMHKEAYFS